jgi:hypothetical protein
MKVKLIGRKRAYNTTVLVDDFVGDCDRHGNIIFDYYTYKEDGIIKLYSVTNRIALNGRFEFHQEFEVRDLERMIAQV